MSARRQVNRLGLARSLVLISTITLVVAACGGDGDTTPSPDGTAPATSATPAPVASAATSAALALAPDGPDEAQPAPELVGLVNPDGSTFDLATYEGGNTLLFFGYTHCPDVCPATIGEIFGIFEMQPETRAVFVSVDPERDTPAFLAEWTQYFPENFDAITGSPGAIRRAADNYGVKYARVETTSTAGYTMSHTADMFLIDEDGRLSATYPFGTPAAEIAADLDTLGTS
jgi:protein SCO1/2